jgi:nicotinamide mononucleotide (NMN) deamidase PncC
MVQERLLQDAFAGAGFAQHQAKAALLGVDAEDIEDFLLVSQQREGFGVEGIALETKVRADHMLVDS